ncbi:transposase [Turicibacter sp. TJ11]|uniref:transposase n=1 Tax=Turicibacter sp. TJ11 TaxID=2806443 RepID=UPI001F3A4B89|nr:transposase [Turicibacter sp. TJ11]
MNYSIDYGRPAYSPEVMFKLLFLKMLYNLSDERVIQEAQVNMAYKYFLNLDPEDPLMHPSSLTKFRKLRLNQEEILEELLHEVVSQAIEKGFIQSRTLIMDATHTRSQYAVKTPIKILREVSKTMRKQLYRYAPELKGLVPPKLPSTASLEEEITDTQELIQFSSQSSRQNINIQKATEKALNLLKNETYQTILSLSDPEAKMGYKSKTEAFAGYKSHVAITEERLITAIEVTTGEVMESI